MNVIETRLPQTKGLGLYCYENKNLTLKYVFKKLSE